MKWEKAKYSINKGLWGTSVGGDETLTSHLALPNEAFPSQLETTTEQSISIKFKNGEPIALINKEGNPSTIIEELNKLASKFAIGRNIHVGDTILGIKGRVGFEAPGALVLIKAHHLLEKHVLTKWQLQHKDYIANWYGTHLHEGLYLDPVMRDLEALLSSSQKHVTGEVFITLKPYHFSLDGITSQNDLLQSKFGSYGEMNNAWTAEDAKGFINNYGNQTKIFQNTVNHD